jgi:flagellar hook-associated protein 2
MLMGLLSKLRQTISEVVPGNPAALDTLGEIGVSTGGASGVSKFSADSVAGKLVLDEAKFAAALTADPAGVRQLLGGVTGTTGAAHRLESALTPIVQASGVLDERAKSTDKELKRVRDSMADWDTRLALKEKTLRAQFTRLETALSQSQSQQSALGSQLAGLANLRG